jgi:endo-1,4-beta-xylanase
MRGALTLALALLPSVAFAQLQPIIVEAESGSVGAQFSLLSDPAATPPVGQYVIVVNQPVLPSGVAPGSPDRVISFTVTFPGPGVYELYARMRVGPATFNDDSFFYANGFGAKDPANGNDWITTNNLANPIGYTLPTDRVLDSGTAQSNVWKWVRLSSFNGGEPPITFTVPAGALTQTFQVGAREDGLGLDTFAFGLQGVFFTVNDLDNGLPGSTVPPPPPFDPPGPPIALGLPKFLGDTYSQPQAKNFDKYWNQVTPENGGKWGSVEATRDVMNWGDLDNAYNAAKNNVLPDGTPLPLPFRMHTLVWGSQQPAWITTLPPTDQLVEINQWFAAVAARYPDIDFIDVVNEPLHAPPPYIDALGGAGATGWDWVITSFEMARQYFPNAKLELNEFSVENDGNAMARYIEIVHLLQARGLIDAVGVQGHAFSTRNTPAATLIANIDRLAGTGLPIYITELDVDGLSDEVQSVEYQRVFPVFWEHPAIRGVTLWGFRIGHWRTAQGAYLVLDNGAEREAMVWLKGYVPAAVLRPWIETQPVSRTATVGDTVSFTCAGNGTAPIGYQWMKGGAAIQGNASAATSTLVLPDIRTADAGGYACVAFNGAGAATSATATLTVNKALAFVTLGGLSALYDGTPRSVSVTTLPAGLTVLVTYDGSATPPTAPGSYGVGAVVSDADFVGTATGTLVVTTTALSRHASTLRGRLDGSLQMLLPEFASFGDGMKVSGDVLVPGTPAVNVKGRPAFDGTIDGVGAVTPSNYTITIRDDAVLRHLVRRVDPVSYPTVAAPPLPAGTRDVVLKSAGESPGDFATLRDLTLKDHLGQVVVPPGTYGAFRADPGSAFTLGVPGATEPAVYNLQSLTIKEGAAVRIVGPVILNVASDVTLKGAAGDAANPSWLQFNVSAGGLSLDDGVNLSGFVTTPAGTLTITSGATLTGGAVADRIVIKQGGALKGAR